MHILSFSGPYRFLSNFTGQVTTSDGRVWPSVEHAYQGAKSTVLSEQEYIRHSASASIAKKRGRSIHLRRDWNDVKLDIMEDLVRRKFTQSDYLASLLLATGDAILVEGNTWGDRFWGVCIGKGENHLGRILMKVRSELQSSRVDNR